ncbi:MAG: recombination mediator RecR [Oscillospiraceae bacterium]|nr:recombination mediator RecR [Oscillospiraceae bacterium]
MEYIHPLEHLIEKFRKLPGIGYKTAVRLAFAVLDMSKADADDFAEAIIEAKTQIKTCSVCCNISEEDVCELCSSEPEERSRGTICVVEAPKDVSSIEKMREYKGLYHVLGGLISPVDGIGPDRLNIKKLLSRLDETVSEVIIATNPSVEGEATAMYLGRLIKPMGIKVTRLAYGLPAGGELEYADELTLARAFEGRTQL